MKKIIFLIVVLGMFLSACEWRSFELTPEYNEAGTYVLNSAGSFNETNIFDLEEVLEDLEIPEDSEIEGITIQSISITGRTLSGNTATGINIQGTLTYGSETVNLFTNNNIPITNSTIPETAVTNLNSEAIGLIKEFLSTKISIWDRVFNDGEVIINDETITIQVNGTTTPGATALAHLELEIRINFSMTLHYCVKTLPLMGGDKCY